MSRKTVPFRFDVLTIFPKMFAGFLSESLLGKGQMKGLVDIRVHDIRDHTTDKHHTVDDRPFGGGPGMVMKAEPLFRALRSLGVPANKDRKGQKKTGPFVIHLSPQGRPLTQTLAANLTSRKKIVLLCGHYEGIDERLQPWIDLEVSVGDVVYTGGEVPAMAVIDSVARLLPGIVKEKDSLHWDSFAPGWKGQLDCPHFTRPALWRGKQVPRVLLGGDHQAVRRWREEMSRRNTKRKRKDLA